MNGVERIENRGKIFIENTTLLFGITDIN